MAKQPRLIKAIKSAIDLDTIIQPLLDEGYRIKQMTAQHSGPNIGLIVIYLELLTLLD